MKKNCCTCAKQNICPKAKNIENYRFDGCSQYISEDLPDGTVLCSECGGVMEFIHEYHYKAPYNRMVTGDVYHCEECGNDETFERKWECLGVERRHFFHG